MLGVLVAAAAAQTAPEPAPSDDEAAREADIFGASAPAPVEPVAPAAPVEPVPVEPVPAEPVPATRDDAELGGFESREDALTGRLRALDDRLVIGGRVWLQAVASVPEAPEDPDAVRLDAPNLLDLFVDARPSDHVRAYASGRLQHDWTVRQGDTDPLTGEEVPRDAVLLDQLWLKADADHAVFVTAGKQRIKWGTGRFWNPTDFLNRQRLDPLAIFDLRTGVDLLKVHVPVEPANTNLYAIANLADAQALDEIGAAFRAEVSFGSSEITASTSLRRDQPLQLGADLSSGLGPFDLRVEVAALHGVDDPHWVGRFDPLALQFPREVDVSDEWLVQVVAGAEWTIRLGAEDQLIVGAEGFHDDRGYPSADLLPWLFVQGQYVPLYLGEWYAGGYVLLPGPGRLDDHTFATSAITNLSDRSVLLRFDWRATVLTWLEPNAFVQVHAGETGELRYGLEIPEIPGFTDALTIPRPLAEVGIGAVARF